MTARRSRGSTRRRPRRATSSRSRRATACSSAARRSRRAAASAFTTLDPATEEPLARGRAGEPRRTSTGGRAPRAAPSGRSWGELPGRERAKYLFRIARILQERSREFAVLESLDTGKPIKEIARRRRPARGGALLVLRRLGGQARLRVPGPRRPAARRRRPDHPVELPAADAGLEDRPGPGRRQHGRPQAGLARRRSRALLFADVCRQADLPPGVVNIVTGPGEIGHGAGHPPGRRQGRLHRLDRGRARRSAAASPAPTRRSPWSSAARPPTSSSTTRRSTRPSRASSTASTSTRARSAARARACSSRSRSPSRSSSKLKDRLATIRVGDPLDKNTDVGRDQLEGPAREDHRARRRPAWPRAPSSTSPPATCPSAATSSARRCSPTSPRAIASPARRSSGRSCRCSPSGRRTRRSRRPTTRPTACRPGSGPTRAAAS